MDSASNQSTTIGQWVVSLAISVVCCAVLFVVFAGYLMGLHDKQALMQARVEVMQERQSQLASELMYLRRPVHMVPVMNAASPPSMPEAPSASDESVSAPEDPALTAPQPATP